MADDKDKKVVSGVSGFSILIGLMILFSLWLVNNGPNSPKNRPPAVNNTASSQNQKTNINNIISRNQEKIYSLYRGQISLSSGTARSTYQPSQEYIILSARGNDRPINIGGWTLKNGRDKQLYVVSGNTIRSQATAVRIPSLGVVLYNPYQPQNNYQGPITLKSGERAIITTGLPAVFSGVTVRDNFKLNKCLGYLEDEPGYRAYPSLKYRCPSSDDVPGISYLDNACYDFARSIRPCHTPKDVYVKNEGYCLDRNCRLTSYCRNFIKENYNLNACFARYANDKDFIGPEWRVFLNQTFELWSDRRETISLYDNKGLLVTEISY